MINVKIKGIEVYHGENVLGNERYFEHYNEKDKDVKHFFEDIMGRKNRFLVNPEKDNANTMAVKAAQRVLSKCNLKGEDIDMIIFSTMLPEYIIYI